MVAATRRVTAARKKTLATSFPWGPVFDWLLRLAIFGFLICDLYLGVEYVTRPGRWPVTRIEIQGSLQYQTTAEIEHQLAGIDFQNFFSLDLNEVYRRVAALPWVSRASIKRRWPDLLRVELVEQEPAVYWGPTGMLNQDGMLFSPSVRVPGPWAQLNGPEGQHAEVWQVYLQLQEILATEHLELKSLSLSERQAWTLQLTDGLMLYLGKDKLFPRIQMFLDVYPALIMPALERLDYIDLRYDTGMAMGWKPEYLQTQLVPGPSAVKK